MRRVRTVTTILVSLGLVGLVWVAFSDSSFDRHPPETQSRPGSDGQTANPVQLPEPNSDDPKQPETTRARIGSAPWFAHEVLHPIETDIKKLRESAGAEEAFRFLRDIVDREPVTFEERMKQAGAIRLIPFAVAGHDGLTSAARLYLAEIVGSNSKPTYSRMAAVAALFGLDLNYDVRPVVSGPEEYMDREVYTIHFRDHDEGTRADQYDLRSIARSDLHVHSSLRGILEDPRSPCGLLESACKALSLSPLPEDVPVLGQALRNEDLYIGTKRAILNALVQSPGDQNAVSIREALAWAEASSQHPLARECRESLVELGILVPKLVEDCKKGILEGKGAYRSSEAVALISRAHARTQAPEARALLESVLLDPGRSAKTRIHCIEEIVKNLDRMMISTLKAALEFEQDLQVRSSLEQAVSALTRAP